MLPEKPRVLSASASETGERLGPQFVALGVLTPLDARPFATHCETPERYREANRLIAEQGLIVPNGGRNSRINPASHTVTGHR
jgi:phage terminase small subunit